MQLVSHAHQLMVEFRAEMIGGVRDGELIYVAYDWEHPPLLKFDPPARPRARGGLQVRNDL